MSCCWLLRLIEYFAFLSCFHKLSTLSDLLVISIPLMMFHLFKGFSRGDWAGGEFYLPLALRTIFFPRLGIGIRCDGIFGQFSLFSDSCFRDLLRSFVFLTVLYQEWDWCQNFPKFPYSFRQIISFYYFFDWFRVRFAIFSSLSSTHWFFESFRMKQDLSWIDFHSDLCLQFFIDYGGWEILPRQIIQGWKVCSRMTWCCQGIFGWESVNFWIQLLFSSDSRIFSFANDFDYNILQQCPNTIS